jgi:hypothetical protein
MGGGMRYQLISSDDMESFEKEVNAVLADGWVPMGGVHVLRYESGEPNEWNREINRNYYQAVVKEAA